MLQDLKKYIIILSLLALILPVSANNYTIVGEEISTENQYGRIEQNPVNLYGENVISHVNVTNKLNSSMCYNIAMGFNQSNILITKTEYLNGENWNEISLDSTINYGGKWYYRKGINFNTGETKRIRQHIKVPFNNTGKFDVFVWRCSDTVAQALSNGKYILLDPWWNASFGYRREIVITENSGSPLTNYQVNISFDTQTPIAAGNMQADCDDMRIRNSTSPGNVSFHFWVEPPTCNTTDTQIWVKVPTIAASTNTSIFLYYGNAAVANIENGNRTFTDFQDFDEQGHAETISNWSTTSGTPVTSTTRAHSGTTSAYFDDADDANRVITTITGDNDTRVIWWTNSVDSESAFWFGDETTTFDIYLAFRGDDGLYFSPPGGGFRDTGVNGIRNVWEKQELRRIFISNNSVDWIYRDLNIKKNLPFRNAATFFDKFSLDTTALGTIYVDTFITANYTDVEPTYTILGEEIAPSFCFINITSPLDSSTSSGLFVELNATTSGSTPITLFNYSVNGGVNASSATLPVDIAHDDGLVVGGNNLTLWALCGVWNATETVNFTMSCGVGVGCNQTIINTLNNINNTTTTTWEEIDMLGWILLLLGLLLASLITDESWVSAIAGLIWVILPLTVLIDLEVMLLIVIIASGLILIVRGASIHRDTKKGG